MSKHSPGRLSTTRVLLALLISIVAVSAISAAMLTRYLSVNLLQRDAELTQQLVQSAVNSHKATDYFTKPDLDAILNFERFLDQLMRLPDITHVNVFSLDGTVLWSSSTELIGQQFPDNDELQHAATGALTVESGKLDSSTKPEHVFVDQRFDQWFVESYFPIRSVGKVYGVIELYKLPRSISVTLNNIILIIWSSAALVAAVLSLIGGWFFVVYPTRKMPAGSEKHLPRSENRPHESYTLHTPNPHNKNSEAQAKNTATAPKRIKRMDRSFSDQCTPTRILWVQRPRAQWMHAIAALFLATLTPVGMGAFVLYTHGVDNQGKLGALTDNSQSFFTFVANATSLLLTSEPENKEDNRLAAIDIQSQPSNSTDVLNNAYPGNMSNNNPIGSSSDHKSMPLKEEKTADSQIKTDQTKINLESPTGTKLNELVSQEEILFWESIKDREDNVLFSAYLERFPTGVFRSIASRYVELDKNNDSNLLSAMIELGWQAFDRNSLTIPEHDNAVLWSSRVLELESDHDGALDLLYAVIDTYLRWSADTRKKGNQVVAQRHLQRAQSLYKFASEEQLKTIATLHDALHNSVAAEQALVSTTSNNSTSESARKLAAAAPTAVYNDDFPGTDNTDRASGNSLIGLLARLQKRLAELGRSR
jgi:hypothetical protein